MLRLRNTFSLLPLRQNTQDCPKPTSQFWTVPCNERFIDRQDPCPQSFVLPPPTDDFLSIEFSRLAPDVPGDRLEVYLGGQKVPEQVFESCDGDLWLGGLFLIAFPAAFPVFFFPSVDQEVRFVWHPAPLDNETRPIWTPDAVWNISWSTEETDCASAEPLLFTHLSTLLCDEGEQFHFGIDGCFQRVLANGVSCGGLVEDVPDDREVRLWWTGLNLCERDELSITHLGDGVKSLYSSKVDDFRGITIGPFSLLFFLSLSLSQDSSFSSVYVMWDSEEYIPNDRSYLHLHWCNRPVVQPTSQGLVESTTLQTLAEATTADPVLPSDGEWIHMSVVTLALAVVGVFVLG
jgi:hypothetical protein